MQLLLATTNKNKVQEYRQLLKGVALKLPNKLINVPETGPTFCANALLKAKAYGKAGHQITLADDSGLCIDSLRGQPGINSARFAAGNFALARKKILQELINVPAKKRTAKFVCCVALYNPATNRTCHFSGEVSGTIAFKSAGNRGFGYDSIFIPRGYTLTFAQMPACQKNRLSHRFKALTKLRPRLVSLLKSTPPGQFLPSRR